MNYLASIPKHGDTQYLLTLNELIQVGMFNPLNEILTCINDDVKEWLLLEQKICTSGSNDVGRKVLLFNKDSRTFSLE